MAIEKVVMKSGNITTRPVKGDMVVIEYTGWISDKAYKDKGKKFDSSKERGRPFEVVIGVGKLIRGLEVGILEMSIGEKSTFHVTSDDAYGSKGFIGLIAPDTDLVWEIELLDIKNPETASINYHTILNANNA